jgi:hypothetical protein
MASTKTINPHAQLIKTLVRRADGHKAVAESYDKQLDDAYAEINELAAEQSSHYELERQAREQADALSTLS